MIRVVLRPFGIWGGLVLAAVLAISCSNSSDSGGQTVQVSLTDAGCEPAAMSLPAGPTTFEVTNKGANAVTEFEILSGSRIIGEVENVAPGLKRSFSLTLKPGGYIISCPGGEANAEGLLTVTEGSVQSSTDSALVQQAVDTYVAYLNQQTAALVAATKPFTEAVIAGDIDKAKSLYAAARAPYERIEPVAESFGDLDPEIDGREGDPVPEGLEWGGFHRIEKALWEDESLEGMTPVAQKLMDNVTHLETLVKDVDLEPATIANGAVELLNEVSSSKITGEEERYSHIDLVDFEANLDGSRQAFESVKPLLEAKDADLSAQIEQRFDEVTATLSNYKRGDSFYSYTELTQDDTKKLSNSIDALAEPLSEVAKDIVA